MIVGIVSALALSGVDLCPDDFSAKIEYQKQANSVTLDCYNAANTLYTDVCLAARAGAQCCIGNTDGEGSHCTTASEANCGGQSVWCDLSTPRDLGDGEVLAIVLGSVAVGLSLFGIMVSSEFRKMLVGLLYIFYLVTIIVAAALLLDEHFETPYKFQTDQDVDFRLDFVGIVLTVVGAAHLVIGTLEYVVSGSLKPRYVDGDETHLGNIVSDILIGVSFVLGIVVVASEKDELGYYPEDNDHCTKVDSGFYYCGTLYGVAAAGLVLSVLGNLFCIFNRFVGDN